MQIVHQFSENSNSQNMSFMQKALNGAKTTGHQILKEHIKNYQINKKRGNSKQSHKGSKNQSIHYKPMKGEAIIDSNNSLEVPINPSDTMIIKNKHILGSNHKLNLTNIDNSIFDQHINI